MRSDHLARLVARLGPAMDQLVQLPHPSASTLLGAGSQSLLRSQEGEAPINLCNIHGPVPSKELSPRRWPCQKCLQLLSWHFPSVYIATLLPGHFVSIARTLLIHFSFGPSASPLCSFLHSCAVKKNYAHSFFFFMSELSQCTVSCYFHLTIPQ